MKCFMKTLNTMLAFVVLLVLAACYKTPEHSSLPPFNALAVPDARQLADRMCAAVPFLSYGAGQMVGKPDRDPQTGNILGTAYAHTFCKDEQKVYRGCSDIEWDPTGTTVLSYTTRWRVTELAQIGRHEPKDWVPDVRLHCFQIGYGGNGPPDTTKPF
jgi:hypothetical protein